MILFYWTPINTTDPRCKANQVAIPATLLSGFTFFIGPPNVKLKLYLVKNLKGLSRQKIHRLTLVGQKFPKQGT